MMSKSLSADNMELIRANKFCLGGKYECGGPADMESINSVMNFVIKLALISVVHRSGHNALEPARLPNA